MDHIKSIFVCLIIYCYITHIRPLFQRKTSFVTPFLFSSYFHTHPVTLLLQIFEGTHGRMHGPSPNLKFLGDRPPSPPKSPPMLGISNQMLRCHGLSQAVLLMDFLLKQASEFQSANSCF